MVPDEGYIDIDTKGKVSEKVVLKVGWSLAMGSFTWKHEGKLSEKVVLKEGWSLMVVFYPGIHYSSGGGFFLACEDSGEMFDNSSPVCAFFFPSGG